MARISFSPLAIKNLQPPVPGADGQVLQADYFDESMPGFGLRISSNKVRTWFVMDRLHGKVVRISLGRLPRHEFEQGLTLAQARVMAMEYRGKLRSGVDPRAEPEEAAPQPTFKEAAARFVEEWAKPRTRRWNETERILEKLVTPSWAPNPLGRSPAGMWGRCWTGLPRKTDQSCRTGSWRWLGSSLAGGNSRMTGSIPQ